MGSTPLVSSGEPLVTGLGVLKWGLRLLVRALVLQARSGEFDPLRPYYYYVRHLAGVFGSIYCGQEF